MRIQRVSKCKPQKRFCSATLDCLSRSENTEELCMLGGVSRDGTYGWLARGSSLEVFLLSTGQRLSAWCFGALLKEPSTVITAVCECYYNKGSTLVVATSTINPEGLVCLFDPKNSKIIKTIEIPYAVKSLEVVGLSGQRHGHNILLSDQLKLFCGILAVGTHCGHVYLIDLCLDDDVEGCDELSPNTLQRLDGKIKDVTGRRYNARSRGKHLFVELGEEFHVRGYYNYCKSDGTQLQSFSADDICVSCIKFIERTAMLVVGFSFGTFQLWRLQEPVLEYCCRYDDNLPPVNSITYQEPENDPRNYCYLWVARGPQPSDSVQDYTSGITLYQLGFEKKTWHSGFGYLFEDLKAVGPRFEHDLTSDPFNLNLGGCGEGSRVISCYTIEDPNYQLSTTKSDVNDSFEGSGGPDLSMCVIVWEAATVDPHVKPPCYMGLFDMNRWYHAQMPGALRLYGSSCDVCPYFAMCSLEGIQQQAGMDNIMAVHIGYKNLSRFRSVMIPEAEQFFFPSALAFSVTSVTESGIVHAKFLGIQRQILHDLQVRGPSILAEPHELYNLCLHTGLLPRNVEQAATSLPTPYKREALLTMALNHKLTGFIYRCATFLASGEMTSDGWSLRFLLEWAWKRVATIKENIDKLCVSLYDMSGLKLDKQTRQVLGQNHSALACLSTLLTNMAAQGTPTTEQGVVELCTKQRVVSLITDHVDLVLWLYSVSLLPEHSEEQLGDDCFVYPIRALTDFYIKRRAELQKLHSIVKPSEILMIDALIARMGEPLSSLWEKEGASGQYPPPSLHALVYMYLLDNVSRRDKLIIVFYLLCDLFNSAPDELRAEYNEKIRRFTQKYDLPLGLSKLVQGMWLLDHKEFEDSICMLLDPNVKSEIQPWQHRCVLKSLLYQGKPKLALQYLQIRSPPLATPDDIKLKLTVLLANGLTAEAFEFQRISRDKNNVQELLSHLFLGCQQTKTVDQLLLLPFSEDEERHLVNYLMTSSDLRSQELLVLYYLQRARYVEAIRLNYKIKQQCKSELDPAVRERTRIRNCLVDGYHKLLPGVQRKLCLGAECSVQQAVGNRREYERPTPLSTVVHKLSAQTQTRSSLLKTVLNKVHELKEDTSENRQSDASSLEIPESEQAPGPFVCTPITPRTRRKTREVPDVVFPQVADEAPLSTTMIGLSQRLSPLGPSSPYKSRRSSYGISSPLKHEVSRLNTTLKRRQHLFTAEALSLLKTPPVKKKTPCRTQAVPRASTTPHSILKVSHPRPVEFTEAAVTKLDFKVKDISLPTPPAALRPPLTSHLRFANLSPDFTEEDVAMETSDPSELLPSPSARRSIRDRSPTPERKSPKMSSRTDAISPTKHSPAESSPFEMELQQISEVIQSQQRLEVIQSQQRSEVIASSFEIDESSASSVDMEDDVVAVDDEVTLNFGDHSRLHPVMLDDTSDTEPLAPPAFTNTGPDVVSSTSENDLDFIQIGMKSSDASNTLTRIVHSEEHVESAPGTMPRDVCHNDSNSDMVSDRLNEPEPSLPMSSVAPPMGDGSDDDVLLTEEVTEATSEESPESLTEVDGHSSQESLVCPDADSDSHSDKLVRKDVFEEGECEEIVTEVKSPDNKVTKTIKTTSITKTTSIKVIDVRRSCRKLMMSADMTSSDDMTSDMEPAATSSDTECRDHRNEVISEVAADSTSHDLGDLVKVDSTSTDITDTDTTEATSTYTKDHAPLTPQINTRSKRGRPRSITKTDPGHVGITASSTRRRTKATMTTPSLNVAVDTVVTPSRRSTRSTKLEEAEGAMSDHEQKCTERAADGEHSDVPSSAVRRSLRNRSPSTICHMCRVAQLQSKRSTPTRSTRSSSRQPSASPKSTSGSPTISTQPRTPTRSTKTVSRVNRSKSPTSTTEVRPTAAKVTPSRASSRANSRASSPALSNMETASEESFVMRLRSGHSILSRETTPDSIRTVSTVNEQERTEFTFSAPVTLSIVKEDEAAPVTPVTPVPDFIFSPPLTRSRQRRGELSHSARRGLDAALNSSNVIADMSVTSSPAKKIKTTRGKAKTAKKEAEYSPSIDSVINFVPLPTEEELVSTRKTRTRGKKVAESLTSLRTRYNRKKRSPLKWTSIKDK